MTSVVDTSVKHFMHTMAAAPVLSGTAGAMIAVLDACLVNGFDVKVATSLVVASGVATLSFAGTHSATVDSVVLVEGVTGAMTALNGEQKVTAIGVGTVSFATAAADGTAAGTISFKMAPAGWEKSFSGTNLAVYQSLDPTSTKMLLRVDDTGTTDCRLVGYEAMTDLNTGFYPFPSAAQIPGGGYWPKSNLSNSVPVLWSICADSRTAFVSVSPYTSSNAARTGSITRIVGDVVSSAPAGDTYAYVLGVAASGSIVNYEGTVDAQSTVHHYMPRPSTNVVGSTVHALISYSGTLNAVSGADNFFGAFPPPSGALCLSKKYVALSTASPIRGDVPGLYTVPQSGAGAVFPRLGIVNGSGVLAGRRLLTLQPTSAITTALPNASTGASFVDITGPWR